MPYTAAMDVHPLVWAVFVEWCKRVGSDPEVWIRRMEQRVPVSASTARVLLETYGIPEETWWLEPDMAPAVHTEGGMETDVRAARKGRRIKNPNTPLGPFMIATGESYASLGRALKMPYQTIQFYDQGKRTPPEDFPHRVEKLTAEFEDGKYRVPATRWKRRK